MQLGSCMVIDDMYTNSSDQDNKLYSSEGIAENEIAGFLPGQALRFHVGYRPDMGGCQMWLQLVYMSLAQLRPRFQPIGR
jgi:hypothetical protein